MFPPFFFLYHMADAFPVMWLFLPETVKGHLSLSLFSGDAEGADSPFFRFVMALYIRCLESLDVEE